MSRCGGGRHELTINRAARRAYLDGGNTGHLHPAGAASILKDARRGASVSSESLSSIEADDTHQEGFNLLIDDVYMFEESMNECYLFEYYFEDIESACRVFCDSHRLLSRHLIPGRDAAERWSAPALYAARTARSRSFGIFQRKDRMSMADAVWSIWADAASLTLSERLALLAMSESVAGLEIMRDMIQQFDEWAEEDGILDSPNLVSKFRREQADWERDKLGYAKARLSRASDLHAQALTEIEKDKTSQVKTDLQSEQRAREIEAPLVKLGKKMSDGRSQGGTSRKGKTASVIVDAIKQLCEKMKSYSPERVFEEIKKDCEDDEDYYGTSCSELMNDLREAASDPVKVRFQEVPEDFSDRESTIGYRNCHDGCQDNITVGALRNIISKVKPAELKKPKGKIK